jgi:hypothetical protein
MPLLLWDLDDTLVDRSRVLQAERSESTTFTR